jgi:hypothetical protein
MIYKGKAIEFIGTKTVFDQEIARIRIPEDTLFTPFIPRFTAPFFSSPFD